MTQPLPSARSLNGTVILFGERHVVVAGDAPATALPRLLALARTKATVHVLGETPLARSLATLLDEVPVFVVRSDREARDIVAAWQRDKFAPLDRALNSDDVTFAYGVGHAS